MTIIKTLAVAGAFAMLATGGAFAKTISSVGSDGTCSIGDTDPSATACYGVVWTEDASGGLNDSEDLLNNASFPGSYDSVGGWLAGGASTGIFGHDDWDFLAKDDNPGGDVDNGLSYTIGETSSGMDGTWSWDGPLYDEMVLVLKQGSTFAAYLFEDATDILSGEWMTTETAFGKNAGGLSHMSIYGRMVEMSKVPAPAAGFLLIAGLGGLAALRRRK